MFDAKAWEAKNKERRRAQKAASYAANRERELAKSAAYVEANRDKVRAAKRAYYLRRKQDLIEYQVNWKKANPEKVRINNRRHAAANPESGRTRTRNRDARRRAADGRHTKQEILSLGKNRDTAALHVERRSKAVIMPITSCLWPEVALTGYPIFSCYVRRVTGARARSLLRNGLAKMVSSYSERI